MSARSRIVLVAGLLGLAGCSTVYMKGTPLYTGEYPKREGPAEDRVNLWPVAYYRKPALSVLWPLMEATDDHVAARPVFSVYKLDKERHQYNLLPPLVQLDYEAGDHRAVPVFWGKEYFVVFPLAWVAKDEHCYVFPLLLHTRLDGGHDTHVLWPIGRVKHTKEEQGFDIWPLVGRHTGKERGLAYALWPLVGERREGKEVTRAVLPLFIQHRGEDKEGRAVGEWMLLPLAYREHGPERSTTVTPLYAEHSERGRWWRGVLPLLFWGEAKGERDAAPRRWHALVPAFYHERKGEHWLAVTPLGSAMRREDRRGWATLVPVVFAITETDKAGKATGSLCGLLPLVYHRRKGEDSVTCTPLYAEGKRGEARWRVLVPVYAERQEEDGKSGWWALLPAACHWWDGKERVTVTPLWAGGRKGPVRWSMSLPFYYAREDKEVGTSRVLTPLAGRLHEKGRTRWYVVPLLSTMEWREGETDLWFLAPLVHGRWGGEHTQSHVLPLYYADGKSGTFLSLPYARVKSEDGASHVVPPLLSALRVKGDVRRLTALAGLGGARWGDGEVAHHLFPLYSYDSKDNSFQSIPLSVQRTKERARVNVALLLAHYEREREGAGSLQALLPLTALGWDKEGAVERAWAVPLFAWWKKEEGDFLWVAPWFIRERGARSHVNGLVPLWIYAWDEKAREDAFFSPPASWGRLGDLRFVNVLGLLAHLERWDGGRRRARFLLPLTQFEWHKEGTCDAARVVPLFSWQKRERGESLWVFPWLVADRGPGWRRHSLFPLWSYSDREVKAKGTRDTDFRLLGWLYDYRFRGGYHPKGKPEETFDYARARVLWRVMHYERVDGDRSLDLFPFVTWDRRADGTRQFSFLVRLFRSYRGGDGARKLDVLFLPLLRRKGTGEGGDGHEAGDVRKALAPPAVRRTGCAAQASLSGMTQGSR